jgi:hypothetical protein
VVRQVRYRDPKLYMDNALAGNAIAQDEEVARARAAVRVHAQCAAAAEGFALQDFVERTGLPLSAIEPQLRGSRGKGLLERDFGAREADRARLRFPVGPAGAVPRCRGRPIRAPSSPPDAGA